MTYDVRDHLSTNYLIAPTMWNAEARVWNELQRHIQMRLSSIGELYKNTYTFLCLLEYIQHGIDIPLKL